jgi:predicted esterase YcpF (UPF0227 family)
MAKEQADATATFKAMTPAERSAQIDAYRKDLQEQGWREEDIDDAVSQLGADQSALMVGRMGGGFFDDIFKQREKDAQAKWNKMSPQEKLRYEIQENIATLGEERAKWFNKRLYEKLAATLQKAGKSLFNPSGDMTMAGRQSFTPDYDAYGETVEEGRKNAFNLSRSMYDQSKAIELPDFKLIRDDTSLRFYRKEDEDVILVGIRGTDVKSWTDLYTWAVIGANQDLRMTTRFQEDLAKMVSFQRNYPPHNFIMWRQGHLSQEASPTDF